MTWMVRDKTLSDYLQACEEASRNLKNFKRDSRLTTIFEHASYQIGLEYHKLISKQNVDLFSNQGLFDGDEIGNPEIFDYYGLNTSPNTLQYIGVLSNLIDHFGKLKEWNIIEIGGGYGGQCQVIQSQFEVESYTIIDLPEPSKLQKAYLSKFNVVKSCVTEIPSGEWDLVISNYALSEIKDPLQSEYIEKICDRSKHGYITCNIPIISLTQGKTYPDIKGERKTNFIQVW